MKTVTAPRAWNGRAVLFFLLLLCVGFVPAESFAQVTGTVFRDYNADGNQDASEPGFAGVVVTAYAANGTTFGPVNSGADGTYTILVPNGTAVRVEFTGLPAYVKSGPGGAGSTTSIAFATGPASVDFGLNNPAQYCENNPDMATACYVNGDPLAGGTAAPLDAFVSFPYDATGQWNPTPSPTSPMPTHLARFDEVGAVWGVAYQRSTKSIFTSALMKRHVGFGSLGPSGIYKMDYNNPGAVQAWLKLSDLGISAGTDPRTGVQPNSLPADFNQPSYDALAYDGVGKIGLGDIDFSEGGDTLWVVNLFDKKLYALPVGNPAAIPAAPTVKSYQITDPGCDSGDYAPWGLEIHDGEVYVGVVCTAQTSGDETDLRAHMMRLDGTTFTSIFDFGLNYNRAIVTDCCGQSSVTGEWEAWTDQWLTNTSNNFQIYPQPILADMEFDSDGSIIFSLLDRHGHQTGRYNHQIDQNDTAVNYEGMAAGDILRACKVGANYQLESNGQCPTGSATGASNGEGPGGGEYYFDDKTGGSNIHRDIVEGGLALLHGSGQVAATAYSPLDIRSGGTMWFNNSTGATDRRYEVYFRDMNGTFGKAAGLGDLELLCSAAPIQIGNRVWYDADADGIQDAGESGISGVTVSLYSGGGLVSSTTTNADGEYYFTVNPNSSYEIRLDNNADFTSGPLQNYRATKANQGSNDAIDSDAVDVGSGVLGTNVSTGAAGTNDHTYDFGFVEPASLGDYVWEDTNADGIQDGGESGIDGVTVKLLDASGTELESTTTSGGGAYSFTNLIPDTYKVQFVAPSGYAPSPKDQGGDDALDSDADVTTGITATTTLAAGDNDPTLDAGYYQPASLGDRVWIDSNNNGIQDGGENGLDGVTVRLLDPNDSFSVLETETTSGGGLYLFDNLTPGDYVVEFVLPTGYVFSPQNQGADDAVDSDADTSTGRTGTRTLASGDNDLTNDAGVVPTNASLGDFVWYDLDIDGIQDAGEPPVENVTVRLLDPNDSFNVLSTTTTNASGAYGFNNLTPGDYVVEFVLPANHKFTAKDQGSDDAKDSDANTTSGRTATVTLAAGENNPTLDAGIFPKISPVLECVRENGNGTYTASWGYNNPTAFTFTIPVGPENKFSPAPEDRGQPTVFGPGRDFNAFTVTVSNSTNLVWTLTSKTATAGSGSSVCNLADLELEKTVDNAAPTLGSNVTFTLTLTNNGPYANSFPAEVTDVLPAGLTYVSHTLTPNTGSYDSNTGVWSFDTQNGVPLELKIVASADQLGSIENCAQVTDAAKLDSDSDPDNDDGDASEDDEDCASVTVSASRIDLEVTKTVSDPAPNVNDVVTYTVTVVNRGNVDATNVELKDTLPSAISFDAFVGVPPGSAVHASNVITWNPPTIGYVGCTGGSCEPSTFTLEYTATVSSAGTHTNCAEVTAATETDIDSTPNDGTGDEHDCATVTTSGSSGGGGAGVESNGDMTADMAQRLFNRRQDVQEQRALMAAPEPVFFTQASTALVSSAAKSSSAFDIADMVSNEGPQESQAFVTTPGDIILVTNATSVFAADYYRTDGKRIAALFGTTTPSMALYDHTKVTCDRLGGARLTEVSSVEIHGRTFIMSEHRHPNGELDYAISFVVHQSGTSFTVDSRFVPDAYQLLTGTEEIINMQVWSVSPEFTAEMVSDMLTKLGELGDVSFINEGAGTPEVPSIYVSGGTYENGVLNLEFTNWGEATSVIVEGTTSETETAAGQQNRTPFTYTVDVPTSTVEAPFVTAAIELGPLYDISFTVESASGTVFDRAYYGDGPWGFAQGNAAISSFETTAVDSALVATPTDDFLVERNATLTGDVTNWVSLFRYLRPNGQAVDLSDYENIEFTAYGLGNIQLYVEKASITDGNQYGFNLRLNAQPTHYTIPLADLRQLTGNAGFTAEDITSLVFYVTGNGRNSQPFFLVVEDVRFTGSSSSVSIEEDLFEQPETYALEQNYPNPFNPQTTIGFNVPTASEVRLTVFDMLGREISVLVNGVVPSGRHEVVFEAGDLPSGTYLYRLEAAGQTITKTLVLMK